MKFHLCEQYLLIMLATSSSVMYTYNICLVVVHVHGRTHTCEDFCSQHCSSHSCSLFLCPITMVVENHLKWGAPSVLILLTLLVRWNQQIPHTIDPHFEEKAMVFLFVGG